MWSQTMAKVRRISVAEGKRRFTQLLREAQEGPILIVNARSRRLAGALLSPADYARYARLSAYFEALRLSQKLCHVGFSVHELLAEAREELEERGR